MVPATGFIAEDRPPLILDFDQSVRLDGPAIRLPLNHWEQRIRFGCRWSQFRQLAREVNEQLGGRRYGCVFTGSGDYHHLSYLLLQRLSPYRPVQLIVCDNHPDNMRYPFGIHCGSWVYWASRLPQISRIDVLGIGSQDIAVTHAWENHLMPLLRHKLHYWSIGVNSRWLNLLGARRCHHDYRDADTLMENFLPYLGGAPIWLSVDKDVLSPEVVKTNWDQGYFEEAHLQALIAACRGLLRGADITGEVSTCNYHSGFKRWLSARDGQIAIDESQISAWQQPQNALNARLLSEINRAFSAQ
jgi:hypothetical protein